jgi:arginyl-tRNA synthetase
VRKSQAPNSKYQKVNLSLLNEKEEIALMKKLLQFPEVVEDAGREYLPNLLCNYLWELAAAANLFYEKHQVLKAEKEIRSARLFLIKKTSEVLKQGLFLLGIEAPEWV